MRTHPLLKHVRLYTSCRYVVEDRESSPRSFMHVGCRDDLICTCPDVERLPDPHLIGILLHEFAHLANPKGELGNDLWATINWGVVIQYRDCENARHLEWIPPEEIKRLGI
jgi:hypothetical protein